MKTRYKIMFGAQSRLASLAETCTSTLVGLGIAIAMNYLLFWYYGDPKAHVLGIAMWMTVVSVIRGYWLRRLFNTEFWKRWKFASGTFNSMPALTPRRMRK